MDAASQVPPGYGQLGTRAAARQSGSRRDLLAKQQSALEQQAASQPSNAQARRRISRLSKRISRPLRLERAMQLRIWKRIYLSSFVRLNLYTKGFTISFGHRGIGWITFGQRGIRETLDTPLPGVYFSEGQQARGDRSGQHQKRPTAAPINEEVRKSRLEADFFGSVQN